MAHYARSAAAIGQTGGWLVARTLRDARYTVPVCILLICGSLAATAALQMQRDRQHALAAAAQDGGRQAANLAAVTAGGLDRFAAAGMGFAQNPATAAALPGLRNIAVFGADSSRRAILHPDSAMASPPSGTGRAVFAYGPESAIAFPSGDARIVVLFDTTSLAPARMLERAALLPAHGPALKAAATAPDLGWVSASVPGWPLTASAAISTDTALAGWMGSLPLYLFVILGPAVAGAWLAALFVGAFEKHAKAARAVRSLKSTRPVEARLMVRLANAERAAFESLRAKSEFIAHMSHELRTPLNAVIGFSEVIAEGLYGPAGHPKYSEYARDIAQAGRDLHDKIGDILEFANIEAGRYALNIAPVDLAALLQLGLDEHQGRAFNRRVTLCAGICEPGLVRADPLAMKRVVSNLLASALASTGEGGRVTAQVHFEDGAGVLTLHDSGPGFSAAQSPGVGRPFQRFDRAGTLAGAATGLGLGLAIAMQLTRRMGGALRLGGASGAGMEVRLPRL